MEFLRTSKFRFPWLAVIFGAFVLGGCSSQFGLFPPSDIHRTVRVLEPGLYDVHYKWFYVIDHFGPDMEHELKGVHDQDKRAIWDKAFAEAVPKYLESNGLIPKECTDGVVVTRRGEAEGGWGWANFRCK